MSSAPDALFLALQTAVAGKYSLEKEIGRGGMGIVYLARDVRLDRPVALKLLPPSQSSTTPLREGFLREARMAARLSHPHIVPIHAVEEIGEFVFYAMRYVAGETLGERLRRVDHLPANDAARILREVAWALAYAHAQGVIHRDIKPDNILLDIDGDRAMVTDFGIARLMDDDHESGGRVVGTPDYLAPEQAGGEPLDPRADLYSLGAVGFHCLTGRPPFAGSVPEVLAQCMTQRAPLVLSLAPATPVALAACVDRALAREAAQRHESAEAMAEALRFERPEMTDLPVPVRIWVERGRDLKGFYLLWSCFWFGITTLGIVSAQIEGLSIGLFIMLMFSTMVMCFPWVAHGLWRIHETRRAIEAGVTLDELRNGIAVALARREEEMRFEASRPVHILARLARGATYLAFAVTLGSLLLGLITGDPDDLFLVSFSLSALATSAGGAFGLIFPGRRVAPRDTFARMRRWLWNSPFGEMMGRIANLGLTPATERRSWATWQATETALGSATEQLFRALPEAQRRELSDLPLVVERLEREAARARAHLARGEAGAWSDRLAEAVAAIETLRLGLLRMTVGQEKLSGSLTMDLEAARVLSEQIDFQVAGVDEVVRSFRDSHQSNDHPVPRRSPPSTSLG